MKISAKGFSEPGAAYESGSADGMIISDTADPSNLILDSGAPRERTIDEIAAAAANAPDPALEGKIQEALRAMAIERLAASGEITPDVAAKINSAAKG